MKSKMVQLLQILTNKGSAISDFLKPGLTENEIKTQENLLKVTYPAELHEFLTIFGNGYQNLNSGRDVDTQIMQDFYCLPYNTALFQLKTFEKSIVFGEDLYPQIKKKSAFPFMAAGGEYISLIWGKELYSVVWKRNTYGYPSFAWPSLDNLFSYIIECWERDFFKFDFEDDYVIWDVDATFGLFDKYGVITFE